MTSTLRLYFAAENLRLIDALYPGATVEPALNVPEAALVTIEDRDDARRRLLRGWTESSGPVSAEGLSVRLGLTVSDIDYGLRAIEGLGFILRGRFTPGSVSDEFCDRRLLARIHRYTLDRLRREIDPVSAQDYMRFLLRWQHLTPDVRLAGKAGVRSAIARLQGFEAASAGWERELLAARVSDYRPSWLDELCLAGEVVWARLTPRKAATAGATPTRATPLTVALRRDFPTLVAAVRGEIDLPPGPRTGAAAEIHDLLQQRGALFFDEIVNATRRLRSDVERGLRELVAWGLVTADGFQGLRQLLGRAPHTGRRPGGGSGGSSYNAAGFFAGGGPAGRWSLVHNPLSSLTNSSVRPELVEGRVSDTPRERDEQVEAAATLLLQRYGVLFRDLYPRESYTIPWRDILRALRRLEARGLIRGGRFVSGQQGEQYALPDALDMLRWVRRQERTGERVWVSAVDPVNLVGSIVPGEKVPAIAGRGVLFVDGLPQPQDEASVHLPGPSKPASRPASVRRQVAST